MAAEAQLTPMMAQYRRIKGELAEKMRCCFFPLWAISTRCFLRTRRPVPGLLRCQPLTKRGVVPMCGIPFHAANAYIGRLLRAGRKVAICDQVEEARPGQLVKREITQILSPGTHFDERMLTAERNNFLAAVYPLGKNFGLAIVDLTTGDFLTTELEDETVLLTELERLRPAEIIYPGENMFVREKLQAAFPILNGYDDWTFAPETALFTVREHFKVSSLDGFGLKERNAAIGAAGGILHYLTQHLRRDVANLTRLSFYRRNDFLALDYTTLRHLEILEPLHHDAPRTACLYGALNRTVTPMGARRLRDWLSQPLAHVEAIQRRQEAVQTFVDDSGSLQNFRTQLASVRDLERTIGRLTSGSGNARDLLSLRIALEQIPAAKGILRAAGQASGLSPDSLGEFPISEEKETETDSTPGLLSELETQLAEMPHLVELITRAIVDEPPLAIKEGGIIRDGFSSDLDRNASLAQRRRQVDHCETADR